MNTVLCQFFQSYDQIDLKIKMRENFIISLFGKFLLYFAKKSDKPDTKISFLMSDCQ